MNPYYNWTDGQIVTEITELRAASLTAAKGGIAVVQGEGRRIEYTAANSSVLTAELRELYAEARRRGLDIGGRGGAIGVEFPA